MTDGDPHVRTDLGAYVLGALEPSERHLVERHLDGCPTCRDELSRLSVLPTLLDRLTPEEAAAELPAADRTLPATLARAAADRERRLGRQLRWWRAATSLAAVTAAVVALVAWAPWQAGPDALVVPVSPVVEDAGEVTGTVTAYAWEWGTTVELRVEDLPPVETYTVWAVSDAGHRERAGTWGATRGRAAQVRGASAIPRAQLDRVEVTDPAGRPLFDAAFAARR